MRLFSLLTSALLLCAGNSAPAIETLKVRLSSNVEPRPGHGAMFAVDGDDATYFSARGEAKGEDHFTITLEAPARLAKIAVITGRPDGRDKLAEAALEVSADGVAFAECARLADGAAEAAVSEGDVRAVRVRVLRNGTAPWTLRELRADGFAFAPEGRVRVERKLGEEFGGATITFLGDATLLPDGELGALTEFLEKIGAIYCDKLGEIARRLDTPWERVARTLFVTYKSDTGRGVPAYALGNSIILNTGWVMRQREDSVGMFIHELSHVVQRYPPGNPGWLVEGLADLIRYELSPPDDAWVRRIEAINPKKSDYRRAYGEAAKFLAWVQKTHAPGLARKLSRAMHEGKLRDELWEQIAGRTLDQLWKEYQGGQ